MIEMPEVNKVYLGDCLEILKTFPDNCIDSVVTDPPWGISFMNRHWDYDVPGIEIWKEVLRVLKPGGYLLSFGGGRTYHRMVVVIEDAGFILHPMIGWVFGSNIPKATNLSKEFDKQAGAEREIIGKDSDPITNLAKLWNGWYYGKQSLKSVLSPICMAQKPPEGRMTDNIVKYGVGAVNIDESRIELSEGTDDSQLRTMNRNVSTRKDGWGMNKKESDKPRVILSRGRFPANLILQHSPGCKLVGYKKIKNKSGSIVGNEPSSPTLNTYGEFNRKEFDKYGDSDGNETIPVYECVDDCPVKLMDEQSGIKQSGKSKIEHTKYGSKFAFGGGKSSPDNQYSDKGGASRFFKIIDPDPFFYCAKASSAEKEHGLKGKLPCVKCGELDSDYHIDENGNKQQCHRNDHPTVKSIKLVEYLIHLITPPDGVTLDPFGGSGTTGVAAVNTKHKYILIEKEKKYVEISRTRIKASIPEFTQRKIV